MVSRVEGSGDSLEEIFCFDVDENHEVVESAKPGIGRKAGNYVLCQKR